MATDPQRLIGLDFGTFMLASVVSRGTIFFLICGLLRAFGDPIRDFIEHRLGLVAGGFPLLLIGGFVAAELIFR